MKKALGVLGFAVLVIAMSTTIGCQNQPEVVIPAKRTQAEKDKINAGRGGARSGREDGWPTEGSARKERSRPPLGGDNQVSMSVRPDSRTAFPSSPLSCRLFPPCLARRKWSCFGVT